MNGSRKLHNTLYQGFVYTSNVRPARLHSEPTDPGCNQFLLLYQIVGRLLPRPVQEQDRIAGPDLTHVGGRRSLGAGILPNNQGTLAGWIADSQTIKPGNRMPPYSVLSGEELMAVSAYLDGLE